MPIGQPVTIAVPLGLPAVPVPPDNPPTAETIALGRKLYYDPILSVDNTISCATCHHPDKGFSDGASFSTGVGGKKGGRNSPTVWNSAYYTVQFWDGRAASLEKQAEGPVENPVEMAHTLKGVEQKLAANPEYLAEFEKAFGPGPINYNMVEKAIASFERTVISGNSPFDKFYFGGDKKALSAAAQRGLKVYMDPKKGNCNVCHIVGEKEALFTDNKFHNLGVGADTKGELKDLGRYNVTKNDADRGAFKTPSLRNIVKTAPYMHDGSLPTLKDVVDFYVGGGNSNPHRDKEIRALDFLTRQERDDLLAFLESLTGEVPPNVGLPGTEKKHADTKEPTKGGK
ncbi:MAG: c-type cytochrome [Acidobacteria bacterium]|nr:c-type cytochrome [Acidobacteriota bacterium]